MSKLPIIVSYQYEYKELAQKIAHQLGAPAYQAQSFAVQDKLILHVAERLSLQAAKLAPLRLNLQVKMRAQHPLLKAIGKAQRILDGTAGFAQDSMLLAAAGKELTLVEQSSILALLIEDAIKPYQIPVVNQTLQEYLQNTRQSFDAIYLDPMFDEKNSLTAKVKKHMQYARMLTQNHGTVEELLTLALQHVDRVVLKAPRSYVLPKLDKSIQIITFNQSSKVLWHRLWRAK